MSAPLPRARIDFASADAGAVHRLREEWQKIAQSSHLPKIGYRVAALLAKYTNSQYQGRAWPSDETFARDLGTSLRTIRRGMTALEKAHLIERRTRYISDEHGRVKGSTRHIYLLVPGPPRGQLASPSGHVLAEGTKREETYSEINDIGSTTDRTFTERPTCLTDRTTVVPLYLTKDPNLREIHSKGKNASQIVRGRDIPAPFTGDLEFVYAFDQMVKRMADETNIDDIEALTREAFNAATDSDSQFMPFDWASVTRLTSKEAQRWFVARAKRIAHKAA